MSRKVTRTMKCSKYVNYEGEVKYVPVTMEKENPSIIHDLYAKGYTFDSLTNVKYTMEEGVFYANSDSKELGDNLTDEEEN